MTKGITVYAVVFDGECGDIVLFANKQKALQYAKCEGAVVRRHLTKPLTKANFLTSVWNTESLKDWTAESEEVASFVPNREGQ